MQKYFLAAALVILTLSAQSTIRTLSNNPANLAQFSTMATAINASQSGDTIYVHGSPISYAAWSITDKKLTIIGPGYLPDKTFPYSAVLSFGTVVGDKSSGCKFEGLVFTGGISVLGADSIYILRNYFMQGFIDLSRTFTDVGHQGFVIEGNYFSNISNAITAFYPVNNTIIQNNVFYKGAILGFQNGTNVLINHNLFYGPTNIPTVCFPSCNNLVLSNNIFVRRDAGTGNSNSTFNNNITYLCTQNTPWAMNGNVDVKGNIASQNPQITNQTLIEAGTLGLLLDFTINNGPAKNTGSDGKDMGLLFDSIGFYNWKNSRFSRLPYLFKMNIYNPVIQTGGSITVDIEARKNN